MRQWISVELDGELSEFERALVAGHLAACPVCIAFRVGASRVASELRAAPLERFDGHVQVRRGRRRPSFRLAPVAAALAVGAVGLGSILTSSDLRSVFGNGGRALHSGAGAGDSPMNLLRQAGTLERRDGGKRGRAIRRIGGGPVLHQ